MELGATICTPRNPKCADCPVQEYCKAYSKDLQNNEIIYTTSISQDPRLINKFKKIPSNINDCEIIKYDEIDKIDDFFLIDSIDLLINLLVYILKNINKDYESCVGLRILFNEYIGDRLYFLKNYYNNYDEAVIIFNKEKDTTITSILDLKSIYPNFKTYFIRNIKLDYSISNGHSNVGIINLEGNNYFYKKLGGDIKNKFLSIRQILGYYNFIEKTNKINIDDDEYLTDKKYKIHLVKIQHTIILSICKLNDIIDEPRICFGYLMEIVDGLTITQIFRNHRDYYDKNYDLIESAYNDMRDRLTDQKFVLHDMHGDNLIWNMETNTLTLIDIDISSFDNESRLKEN
jgi:hypothetical protein